VNLVNLEVFHFFEEIDACMIVTKLFFL